VVEDPAIATIWSPASGSARGNLLEVRENPQTFQVFSGRKLGVTKITATVVQGSATSLSLAVVPARPIVFLDASWNPAERMKILVALQQLTGDALFMRGVEIFADTSRSVASNRHTGQTLLRGLQHPTQKVIIAPEQTGNPSPHTDRVGNDVVVQILFAGGDLATFHFFTITGANVPGPGGNRVEKAPGFVPLAHELVHAFRMLRNLFVGGARDHEFFDPSANKFVEKVFREELTVDGIDGGQQITENRIRAEQGLGSREAHASPTFSLDGQGVKPVSAAPPWWPNYPV
jgi:hypothetical protein